MRCSIDGLLGRPPFRRGAPLYALRLRRGPAALGAALLLAAVLAAAGSYAHDPSAHLMGAGRPVRWLQVAHLAPGSSRETTSVAYGATPVPARQRPAPHVAAALRTSTFSGAAPDDGSPASAGARGGSGAGALFAAPRSASRRTTSPTSLKLLLIFALLAVSLWLAAQLRRERVSRRRSEQRMLEFLATAGHELRTPLTAISGYVSLARMGGLADPEKFEVAMDRMTDETRRMSALIDELVLLARLDLGQPLHREPVNLARLCRDAVADAQASSPRHPVRLTILPGQYTVVGDRDRLYQVVANLLANVRHHTPEGTRTVLGLGNEDGHRVIEVIDDGPGVPPELRETAFDRFVHGGKPTAPVPKEGAGGGNGLGLSVASAVIHAHGGTLTLEPSERGAWFRIRLPA
ncbi:HAMP domain-containing sensor histidine kinase [Streptomyces sp. NPDC007206]|uniref:sensor histidine kinase n=1 Tax=Streptomyces sp. NPDC007206 TaxID=3154317 RepID=UPI00340CCC78